MMDAAAGYHHYESKSMQASMEAQHTTGGDNMGPKVQIRGSA
jgi:hypothetical protein